VNTLPEAKLLGPWPGFFIAFLHNTLCESELQNLL